MLNSNTIQYIKLEKKDISQVCALETLCFPTPWSEEQINSSLNDSFFSMFGAKQNDELLGYIALYHPLTEFGDNEIEILNLAVKPEYRRQGLGKQLLNIMLQTANKMGIIRAVLEVRKGNISAINLYKSIGFQQVGLRPRYYSNTNEDALILALDLNS
ncbi:ribosomal protein S18-alanine N-acetyltransferase [Desulfovibrio litoralis]|uniref:Ribosomal-protein-alanine N-acetyltransferase n=1 Tax=Desulfovibrio litoralis DSM 11393 TaxID=1121455 RepID=A0A1M7S0Z1_9BACT|nr:ribosomal protein S18-alanine N-acetyltransferase [Desulfovibrio litoralis]SHN52138.1 ribosomal-protein-alanine N-acetyltransferase [Desulfovibrio litoralis DSM 11393]